MKKSENAFSLPYRFRIGNWVSALFWIVFAFFVAATLWGGLTIANKYWGFLLMLVPVFLFLIFVSYRYQGRFFLEYLLGIALIARIIGTILFHPAPESDFLVQYHAAQSILQGNFSFTKSTYFTYYPYQVGFSVFEAFFLRFNNSVLFLRIVNILFSTASVGLFYGIVQQVTKKRETIQFASILYALFITPIIFNGVLTNNIPGTFFTFLALYLALQADKRRYSWLWVLFAGITLSIANYIRPDALGCVFAIAVFIGFGLFTSKWRSKLVHFLMLIVAFWGFNSILAQTTKATGLAPNGMALLDPYWKFSTGLDLTTNGQYSPQLLTRIHQLQTTKNFSREAASKKVLGETINKLRHASPSSIINLAINKQNIFWIGNGGLSFATEEVRQSHPRIVLWLDHLKSAWTLLTIGLSLFALLPLWRKQYSGALLITFFIFTFACINSLTEVQYRYSFAVLPMWFIIGSLGTDEIVMWWQNKRHNSPVRLAKN